MNGFCMNKTTKYSSQWEPSSYAEVSQYNKKSELTNLEIDPKLKLFLEIPQDKRIVKGSTINDLIGVTLHAAFVISGTLTYLVGCGIASNESNQVCYLQHRMVLTEAAGDAELLKTVIVVENHVFYLFKILTLEPIIK